MGKIKHLRDVYKFTNFRPEFSVSGRFGDPIALVIRLHRRSKKLFAECVGLVTVLFTTKSNVRSETLTALIEESFFWSTFAGLTATSVAV